MKIDITSIKLERTSDSCVRIALKQASGQYEKYDSFFCISINEWQQARACMLGITDFYPYFDDCTYLLKFIPSGLRVAYIDNHSMDYFTFPSNELVFHIDSLFALPKESWRDETHIIDLTGELEKWALEYGPLVVVNCSTDVQKRLTQDIKSSLLSEPAKDLMTDLVQWASQYSNGNKISVNISFDNLYHAQQNPDVPTSYYWYIRDDEQNVTIVNGGYIAHEQKQDDGTILYCYSMHT